ncbi:phototropic-responsive NPH3 family protein [Artemisia annua]|uniref:Phototropic-responsive NPH3 family protein n=1 Tax=Artemisia annua TaxID=35608 RepID=A0A2U1NGE5_ARTAN|nr:phototropic-responsive NPH3 family protein [Artemisia annua]
MESEVVALEEWQNLRVVETIYEEDSGDESVSSTATSHASLVHPSSPSSASLRTRVKLWSLSNGVATNVVVHVQGSSFNLHKDPLTRCSRYLKRHLMESSEITISPPLKITSHTFTLVVDYCYGGHLFITPFNVASLILASELLEMTVYSDNIENLRQKTETYFCRTAVVDRDYATVVLKSCIGLLPDVETRTGLVSRCIEALSLNRDVGDDILRLFDGVQELSGEEFRLLVGALHQRLNGSHDLLYRIIDFYFKEEGGKMAEEQRSKICNYIDCSNLSPQVLMHAVQNPRMPLRFIVQAMFIEQLNTRRSVFTATQTLKTQRYHHRIKPPPAPTTNSITLGAILQRDAALRQVAHLKATMDYTSSRIQSLEEEINGMRKILVNKSDTSQVINGRVKSESFRFSSERNVERGQRGSVSSGSFRVVDTEKESDYSGDQVSPRRLGKRVMNRLKSAFRLSGLGRNRDEVKVEKKSN